MVTDILDASEAQAKEDLELLESLTEQVARDGAEHLLPVLAEMPPVFNTDTRELIDSILIAGERDVGTRGAENTGVAVDHARRKASQRVVDLVDIEAPVFGSERASYGSSGWADWGKLRRISTRIQCD